MDDVLPLLKKKLSNWGAVAGALYGILSAGFFFSDIHYGVGYSSPLTSIGSITFKTIFLLWYDVFPLDVSTGLVGKLAILSANVVLWAAVGGLVWDSKRLFGAAYPIAWLGSAFGVAMALIADPCSCNYLELIQIYYAYAILIWLITYYLSEKSLKRTILRSAMPAALLFLVFYGVLLGSGCVGSQILTARGFNRIMPQLAGSGINNDGTPYFRFTNMVGTGIIVTSMELGPLRCKTHTCIIDHTQIKSGDYSSNTVGPSENFWATNVTGCLGKGNPGEKYELNVSIRFNVTAGGASNEYVEKGTIIGGLE
jgi:hypothetical protein